MRIEIKPDENEEYVIVDIMDKMYASFALLFREYGCVGSGASVDGTQVMDFHLVKKDDMDSEERKHYE